MPTGSRPDKNHSGKNGISPKPSMNYSGVNISVNTIRTQSEGGTIEEEKNARRLENYLRKK